MVDPSRKFWNTFFEIALELEPVLRIINNANEKKSYLP